MIPALLHTLTDTTMLNFGHSGRRFSRIWLDPSTVRRNLVQRPAPAASGLEYNVIDGHSIATDARDINCGPWPMDIVHTTFGAWWHHP